MSWLVHDPCFASSVVHQNMFRHFLSTPAIKLFEVACQDTCLVFLWVSSLQWSLEASCSFKTLLWSTYNGWRIVNVSPPQLYIPVIPWCFNFGIVSSFPALALLSRGRWGSLFFAIKDTSVRDPNRQCKTTQHNMQWTHTHFSGQTFWLFLRRPSLIRLAANNKVGLSHLSCWIFELSPNLFTVMYSYGLLRSFNIFQYLSIIFQYLSDFLSKVFRQMNRAVELEGARNGGHLISQSFTHTKFQIFEWRSVPRNSVWSELIDFDQRSGRVSVSV